MTPGPRRCRSGTPCRPAPRAAAGAAGPVRHFGASRSIYPPCPRATDGVDPSCCGYTTPGTGRSISMSVDMLELYSRASEWANEKVAAAVTDLRSEEHTSELQSP